jgi:NAD(P)-dependent dehydrogenase (short-subunit alcohol dehydrogenase family)
MAERTLAGKTALVTGSGRGIGAAIAEALARGGCAVALHDRTEAGLDEAAARLAAAHGVACAGFAADLAQPGAATKLFAALDRRLPPLDILVNNAGYETAAAAEEMDEADWRGVLEVNLTAPFLLAQQAARRMKGRGGVIINISSMHDSVPRKGLAHYAAAKAGLSMLTRSLALEWAEYGIRVLTVSPGAVETDMNREAIDSFGRDRFEGWIPAGRLGTVDDVAAAVAFLCGPAASYITGTELRIDGGYGLNLVRYDDRPGRDPAR